MSNPWLKKNPFMSLWLSEANRMAGSLRGQATAQAKRQVKAAVRTRHHVLRRGGAGLVGAAGLRKVAAAFPEAESHHQHQ